MDRPPSYRWIVLGLLWAFSVATSMGTFSLMIMLPTLREDLQVTPVQAGWLSSVFWLVTAITNIAFGAWISRFSPKKSIGISILLAGIFLVGQGWAPTYSLELLARIGFVAMIVARGPAAAILVQQWFSQREVARILSFSITANSIGWVAANGVTPFLILTLGGWRPTFYLLGLAHILGSIAWLFLGKDRITAEYRRRELGHTGTPLRVLTKYGSLWLTGLSQAGANLALAAFMTFLPLFLTGVRGLSLPIVGSLMVIFSLGAIVGSLSAGIVADRWGRQKPIIWFSGLVLVGSYLGMIAVPSIPVIGFLLLVAGYFAWFPIPITNSIPYQLPGLAPREVAVGLSLVITLITLGASLGPLLVGYLQEATGSLQLALFVSGLAPISLTALGPLLPETGWKAAYANRSAAVAGRLAKEEG